ncbi:fibronectin type III domain-containing protein [Fimbriimonas ginsengisoli]|uniref:Cellulase n=1 Tax=Fimbriimonas ginsengisoli Gsoil 348 TaxID=661478 RepID=A0A068NKL6_FIMGI|nr:fibronectin type III domain-containing protein [Fimbriimonas ginsengisoli]AIE84026.1 Cellulase precursor [Fimbriimonas ginsengisoli Gsoil 348]
MNYRKTIAAALVLGIVGTAAAQTETVYTDSFNAGWDNWSWATVNPSATAFVHSGAKSIGVTASPWSAIYLHHTALDTSMITGISFWIHGGTTGGQLLQFQATRNGGSQTVVPLSPLTIGWQKVTITLDQMGVAGVNDLDGFWIQDRSGKTQPTWYLDDVQWDGKPIPNPIHLTVTPGTGGRRVDARSFGLNAAAWDQLFDTASTPAFLKGFGTTLLRFPGGSLSDEYHWKTGASNNNNWSWALGFDAFAANAKAIGADAIVTVNYGTGTPEEAADWVRYSNVTKKYGFKHWEVGNECYGDWETDGQNRPHDPVTYANRAADYIRAMKAVDPTIKIGVVAASWDNEYQNYSDESVINPRTGNTVHGWTPIVLTRMKQLGVIPDFVVHHRYDQLPYQESDAFVLKSSKSWADDAARLREMLNDYLGADAANVELTCTENNSVTSNPGKQTTSLVNALFMCDSFGQFLKTEFNMLCWWDLRNGPLQGTNMNANLYGWRMYGDYGVVSPNDDRYPSFFAMQMLSKFAKPGDLVVDMSSEYSLVSAYAVKRPDNSYSVMVINKSRDKSLPGEIQIPGAPSVLSGRYYSFGITQDEAARTGTGPTDIIAGKMAMGPDFTYTFPRYSVTVFNITTAPPTDVPYPAAPTSLVATTPASNQIKLTWADNAKNEDAYRIEISTGGSFTQYATVRANTTTFTLTNLTPNTTYTLRVSALNSAGYSAPASVQAKTLP